MNRTVKLIILILLTIVLVGELGYVGFRHLTDPDPLEEPVLSSEPTAAPTEATAGPTQEPTVAPTETEPEETEPVETEPTEQRYTLTFAGDCTLGSTAAKWNTASSFVQTVGTNYSYPFANVADIFEADDFTIVNLEGPLTETGTAAAKTFAFRGPTAYTEILTGSSVEAVTIANNHAEDYGTEGYKNTVKALNEAGVDFVEKNDTTLLVTDSGLKIGLYAGSFDFSKSDMTADIAALRKNGAEIVICCFHWGTEGSYRPTSNQEYFGRAAIEAGADIVYGSHPHVLQQVEQYKDGYIFYSLGNFSFGGSVFPQDYDSAILQMEVIRDVDGSVSLGELTMIPVSISSMKGQNNFQPTPLEEGSTAYKRVISKLDGTFTGPDLVVDYGKLDGDKDETTPATEPGATEAPSTGETTGGTSGDASGDTSGDTAGDTGSSGDAGADSGSADSGSAGDAGSTSGGDSSGGSADSGNSGGSADAGASEG